MRAFRAFKVARRRTKLLVAVVTVAGVAATAAAAQWIITASSPQSNGSFSSVTAPTFSQPTTYASSGGCSPSATCSAVIKVTNPNSTALTITGFTAGNTPTVSAPLNTPCQTELQTAGMVTIPAQTGLSISVPPGTTEITVPNYFAIGALPDAKCMGSTFQITATSSVISFTSS